MFISLFVSLLLSLFVSQKKTDLILNYIRSSSMLKPFLGTEQLLRMGESLDSSSSSFMLQTSMSGSESDWSDMESESESDSGHLAPGPLSIGAYFEKWWSGYQETFGAISMTEIVSGAHFSCLRSTFLV